MTSTIETEGPAVRPRAATVAATAAQATAFTSGTVLAFLSTDIAAAMGTASAARLWPLGAFAFGLVAAANLAHAVRMRPRYAGTLALGVLTLAAFAAALSVNFPMVFAAAAVMGASAGLAAATAHRLLTDLGAGPALPVSLAAAAAVAAGIGAAVVLPGFGWRAVLGFLVIAGLLATWKFAEHTPHEPERLPGIRRLSRLPGGVSRSILWPAPGGARAGHRSGRFRVHGMGVSRVLGPARRTPESRPRPTMPWAVSATATSASRSTPVSIPMSSSMCTTSSVATLPLAPGA